MKTSTISITIAIVAVVSGIVLYQQQTPESSQPTTATTTDTTVPGDWSTYQDNGLSFSHPSAARISEENERVKIQILGDNNQPNTEVTDGITGYLSTTSSSVSLQKTADRLFTERSETSQEVVAEVASSTFAGRDGYMFRLRNQLGSVTDYQVLEGSEGSVFQVSYTASGKESQQYAETMETIVSSLHYQPSKSTNESGQDQSATSSEEDKANEQEVSLARACQNAGGNWLSEHNECEGVMEKWCQEQGGSFDSCASACRNDPDAQMCTQQCVLVCSF